jgi:hypothetical protein
MRLVHVVVGIAFTLGCQRAGQGSPPPSPPKTAVAEKSPNSEVAVPATAQDPEPKRFELTQGVEVDVGNHTKVNLKTCMYAHLADSKNLSTLLLTVTHDGKHEDVTLRRLYPGPPEYRAVAGLRMAIDFVDAYHQPATGAILILPPSP